MRIQRGLTGAELVKALAAHHGMTRDAVRQRLFD